MTRGRQAKAKTLTDFIGQNKMVTQSVNGRITVTTDINSARKSLTPKLDGMKGSSSSPVISKVVMETEGFSDAEVEDKLSERGEEVNGTVNADGDSPTIGKAGTITSWASLFGGSVSEKLKLSYHLPIVENGEVVVKPPPDVYEEGAIYWENSLVGQFMGRPPSYFQVKAMVERFWSQFGKVSIITTGMGIYLFRFESREQMSKVLDQIWHVNEKPLLLRVWDTSIQMDKLQLNRIPIWASIKGVPLALWNQKGISWVASALGVPLQMDLITESKTRLQFAKVCVEVEIDKPLVESIKVDDGRGNLVLLEVEYAWKPQFCQTCKEIRHVTEKCVKIKKVWVPKAILVKGVADGKHNLNQWTEVGGSKRKMNGVENVTTTSHNPFEVLNGRNVDELIEELVSKSPAKGVEKVPKPPDIAPNDST